MSNDELMTKPEREIENTPSIRHSSLDYSFGIRHSDFVISELVSFVFISG